MIIERELVFGWTELTSWKCGRVEASPVIQYEAAVYVVPISIDIMSFPSNLVLRVEGMSRDGEQKG